MKTISDCKSNFTFRTLINKTGRKSTKNNTLRSLSINLKINPSAAISQ